MKNSRIPNKEKFVYKNINTGAYYPSFDFESDTLNIYDAHVFSSNSFLVFFSRKTNFLRANGLAPNGIINDWESDKYGRRESDYIRVNLNEELKELRKNKIQKINEI